MQVEVTLALPAPTIAQAKLFGNATHQAVEEVLAEALEIVFPITGEAPELLIDQEVTTLSDDAVRRLAAAKMDAAQNRRLGRLQAKGKAHGLSTAERYELATLLRIYQIGLLRKSEALAEAVRRGLREPLKP